MSNRRRQRERREQREAARLTSGRKLRQGTANDYIRHLTDLLVPGLPAVLYCRVSGRTQDKKNNLAEQVRYERQQLDDIGVSVIEVFREVSSGWKDDRPQLKAAAEHALQNNTVLVARSLCRIIRSTDYRDDRNPDALPSVGEYEELVRITGGVTLATRIHPETNWKDVKSEESKQGQRQKNRKGGRPRVKALGYMKRRREEKLLQICELYVSGEHSFRGIEAMTGIPESTVRRWIRCEERDTE